MSRVDQRVRRNDALQALKAIIHCHRVGPSIDANAASFGKQGIPGEEVVLYAEAQAAGGMPRRRPACAGLAGGMRRRR